MSVSFFEGPAGSGKTTRLCETLARRLAQHPLLPDQQILALTKMHGSRRRMQSRLDGLPGLRRRFMCTTVDSFAWHLVRRWRTLGRAQGWNDLPETDYREVCRRAGALLGFGMVRSWITRAFPVVVIDEMQDSKGGQLEIVRCLSESASCLAAADDFQDLDASAQNEAVAWARANGTITPLTQNHRTEALGLLKAAAALRDGKSVPIKGEGFRILGASNVNVGASFVSKNLTWWAATKDIAIITPVGSDASAFVRDLLRRVERGSIGSPPTGPHRVPWEVSQEDECQLFLGGLGLPDDHTVEVRAEDLTLSADHSAVKGLRLWIEHQRSVSGRTCFAVGEIDKQARAIHHRTRAFRRIRDGGVRAMTIHQAKNREFDSVIVLWPYQVVGSDDRKRRLLYNAITRAKRQALVVVQNPDRLTKPPFQVESNVAE
jgi:superfamily I DNA/RNA helicase